MPPTRSTTTSPARRRGRGREHDPERAAAILGLMLRPRIDLAPQTDRDSEWLANAGVPLRELVAEAQRGFALLLEGCRARGDDEGSENTLALWLALSASELRAAVREHLADHANWGPAALRDAVRARIGWKPASSGESTKERNERLALERRADREIKTIEADRGVARKLIAEFRSDPAQLVWVVLAAAISKAEPGPCAQCGAADSKVPRISLAARAPDSANEKWEGALRIAGVLCSACWERAPRVRVLREPLVEAPAEG